MEHFLFMIFCALMRFWIGGLPRWEVTWVKYIVWLTGVGYYVHQQTENLYLATALALITLLMWRGYGHGPLLRYPLGPDTDDALLLATNTICAALRLTHPFPAFALYGALRYGSFGGLLAGAGYFFGVEGWPVLALPGLIPFIYLMTWSMREDLRFRFFVWISEKTSPWRGERFEEQRFDAEQHFHVAALLSGWLTGFAIAAAF